jgi:hypothetical protein
MLKKAISGILLAGLIGVLIWGGVNRTLAKSETSSEENHTYNAHQTNGGLGNEGGQQQGRNKSAYEDYEQGQKGKNGFSDCDDDCDQEPASQGQGNAFGNDWVENEGEQGYKGQEHDEHNGGVEERMQSGQGNGRGGGQGQGRGQGRNAGSREPLDESDVQALHMALDDEYHALATYLSVMETFGDVEPFASIAQSEQRHIEALLNQFNKYDIPVPENPWLGEVAPFESVQQACQTGVEAEIANAELYEELFQMTDNADLIRVFTNLSRASSESHLPEFESCN